MKKCFLKVLTIVVAISAVLSLNAFAAVGDSVENVCLNKEVTDVTGTYWKMAEYVPFCDTVNKGQFPEPAFMPEKLTDGIFDGWGADRYVTNPNKAAIEVDLDGYFTLNTLKTSYLYSTLNNGTSPSKETSIQVSADGGKTWTTVIDKQPLSTDSNDLVKALDSTMLIYADTFNLGGVVANKIRVIYNNTETEQGFNLMEIACSGNEAEAPATTGGSPSTFDGLSVAVAVLAVGACGFIATKKRR